MIHVDVLRFGNGVEMAYHLQCRYCGIKKDYYGNIVPVALKRVW